MAIIRKQNKIKAGPKVSKNKPALNPISKSNRKVAQVFVNKIEEGSGDVELIELDVEQNGTYYPPAGKAFNHVIVNIKDIVKPSVKMFLNPSVSIYDKTVDSLGEITITANVTKGTNAINMIRIQINGVTVNDITEDVADGGLFTYKHTFSPRVNKTFTVKVIAYDINSLKSEVEKVVMFTGKTYYGTIAADDPAPSETSIKALNSVLTDNKGYVYSGINMDYGKVVYAYPQSYGALTSIVDTIHQFSYIDSFVRTEVMVDGTAYYCYTMIDAAAAENVQIAFN